MKENSVIKPWSGFNRDFKSLSPQNKKIDMKEKHPQVTRYEKKKKVRNLLQNMKKIQK